MTTARTCLLFGFPLTPAEFAARLDPTSPLGSSDYLARFAAKGLDSLAWREHLDGGWRTDYGPWAAEPYAALAERARTLGCEVRQAATLADLTAAARPGRILIVVSHWKGAAFMNDDFLPDLEAELSLRLEGRSEPLAAWLRAALQPSPSLLGLWRKSPLGPRPALRAAITARIREPPPDGVGRMVELATTRAASRRELLDQWLAGLVRPGNRLELFDGMHTKEAVAEAMAGLEGGVLDLTVCTGAYLGDYVGSRNKNRFRTVQALLPQDPTEAAARLSAVLRLTAQDSWDYLQARLEIAGLYPRVVETVLRMPKDTHP
jgi:hypothetical protein